jgi:hypothetical protein
MNENVEFPENFMDLFCEPENLNPATSHKRKRKSSDDDLEDPVDQGNSIYGEHPTKRVCIDNGTLYQVPPFTINTVVNKVC